MVSNTVFWKPWLLSTHELKFDTSLITTTDLYSSACHNKGYIWETNRQSFLTNLWKYMFWYRKFEEEWLYSEYCEPTCFNSNRTWFLWQHWTPVRIHHLCSLQNIRILAVFPLNSIDSFPSLWLTTNIHVRRGATLYMHRLTGKNTRHGLSLTFHYTNSSLKMFFLWTRYMAIHKMSILLCPWTWPPYHTGGLYSQEI